MAIIPKTLYPLKFDAFEPAWPQGKPRRILVAGDGTGSPWDLEIVEDIMGLQQALLLKAGVSPTGDSETALVSQYYDCLTTLFARSVATTTLILTTKLPLVAGVQTGGFLAAGDGGGAYWAATGGTGPAGTTAFATGKIYDDDGREFAIVPGDINPRQYGAVGDGVADDVIPIQFAIDTQAVRNGGRVHLNSGTYLISAQITAKNKVTMYGDGVGATIFSWAGAGGSFPDLACIWATGSSDVLPALASEVDPDDTTITFAADHGLVAGDIFTITDDRAASYAIGSAGYKAGEFFVAAEIPTATTVVVETPAFATTSIAVNTTSDTYRVAECTLYKITPVRFAVRDMSVIGRAASTHVIRVDFGRECSFERLNLTSSSGALLRMERSFDTSVADVVMADSTSGGVGVQIAACQRVYLDRVRGGGARALFTAEPLDSVASVVNRQVYLTDCYAPQHDDATGSVRLSANTEYTTISNCAIAGLRLGGDHHKISNCTIWGQTSPSAAGIGVGWGLYLLNMTGLDVRLDGCSIVARVELAAAAAMVKWGDSAQNMDRPSQMVVSNTLVDLAGYSGRPFDLSSRTPSRTPSVRFDDVTVVGANVATKKLQVVHTTGSGWKRVEFHSCRILEVGVEVSGAQMLLLTSTTIERSPDNGLLVSEGASNPFGARTVQFQGCTIIDNWDAGVFIAVKDAVVNVYGTTAINNNVNPSKSSNKSSLVFSPGSGSDNAVNMIGNVLGDDQAVQSQIKSVFYNGNVDTVIDANNVVLGGLVSSGTPVAITISNGYDAGGDETVYTGAVGVGDGDPAAAPTGAKDLAIGSGTGNRGVYFKSASSGLSSIIAGDSGDADRFIIEMDHTNDHFTFTVAGVASCRIDGGGINPVSADTNSVGDSTRRWAGMYAGAHHFKRMFADGGTVVVSATHLALNGGWGSGPSFNGLTAGRDGAVRVVIDSGTTPAGVPEFTYTFPDGASSSEIPIGQVTNRGTVYAEWYIIATTSTTITIRLNATAAASTTYGCNLTLKWLTD